MTGLTSHTIRVWEKRYGAVVAERTDTDRRIYQKTQIERLQLLRNCTLLGESIGSIANLPDDELRELQHRLEFESRRNNADLKGDKLERFQLASLGVPRIEEELKSFDNIDCVVNDSYPDFTNPALMESLLEKAPDLLVIEQSNLNMTRANHISTILRNVGPIFSIVIYRFSNQPSLEVLRKNGVRLLKSPVDSGALVNVIRDFLLRSAPSQALTENASDFEKPYPRHLFSNHQLEMISNIPSKVDCECPTHIVELVRSLKAFELYSSDCSNSGAQDAAFHARIQRKTAEARIGLELLLKDVLEFEGLNI